MTGLAVAAAIQIRDARARSRARAHRAAERRQPSDARLLMDSHEVRQHERAVELLVGRAQVTRVHDERHRHGDALVAAAGVDDHGQLAAAHTRVGRRCGARARAHLHVVAVGTQHDAADVRAPVARQPLVGDGAVAGDLAIQHLAHVIQLHGHGEVPDALHRQHAAIGHPVGRAANGGHRHVAQHLPVALLAHDVRMEVDDAHERAASRRGAGISLRVRRLRLRVREHAHDDVEVQLRCGAFNRDGRALRIGHDTRNLLGRNLGDHFEAALGAPRHDARSRSGLDPLQAAGMGHHHALRVLDDASAGLHLHAGRFRAQQFARPRGRQRDGDGLGASHRGDELLFEYGHVPPVSLVRPLHEALPFALPVACNAS